MPGKLESLKIFDLGQLKRTFGMESVGRENKSDVNGKNENITVKTGLFVSSSKGDLLLRVVQDMLRTRFNTTAVSGPCQPDNTCEIILRSLTPAGANFIGSKGLLGYYLNMINESKSNTHIDNHPEVIVLEDDDDAISCVEVNDSVDDSVVIVEERSVSRISDHTSIGSRNYCDKYEKNMNTGDVVFVSTFDGQECLSNKSCNKKGTTSVMEVSNEQGVKRKRDYIEENEVIEVVDILDDDVIILDDSFSAKPAVPTKKVAYGSDPGPSNHPITVIGSNRCVDSDSVTLATEKKVSQQILEVANSATSTEHASSASSLKPIKKSSKYAYKRCAHLDRTVTHTTTGGADSLSTNKDSNIFNPNSGSLEERRGLRPIVIDGNNVAVSHGKGQFSLKGIIICINYFEMRGHRQIKAFVPQYRKNRDTHDLLHNMERQGTIVITPSRKVNGKLVASYDDRYIVQYATEVGGVVVSTDNYRDLLPENPSWKDTIEKRLLMFTWVEDLLMFPQDPLGRDGPSLDTFLKFPN